LRDDRPIGMTTRVVSTVPDFRRTRADGGYPDSDLVMDRAGHLYGTTVEGGLGSGTMFLTHSGSIWAETECCAWSVQHFTYRRGGNPFARTAATPNKTAIPWPKNLALPGRCRCLILQCRFVEAAPPRTDVHQRSGECPRRRTFGPRDGVRRGEPVPEPTPEQIQQVGAVLLAEAANYAHRC